jgi:hypothetical protein
MFFLSKRLVLAGLLFSIFILTGCGNSVEVMAEDRVFLPLSLEFLGEYQLRENTFKNTRLGGLSGISYDRLNNLFYAVSDDRSNLSPARFYTLKLDLTEADRLKDITVKDVTLLKDENGNNYPRNTVDFEGIAVSPRGSVFVSSEGVYRTKTPPFIKEYDLKTGQAISNVRIPDRFLPDETEQKGIQDNLGFEALTLGISSIAPDDPFRLFTATEYNLKQDYTKENPEPQSSIRFLHYGINPIGEPLLVAEHLYLLEPNSEGVIYNGLTGLTTLDREGYFLSLERTFGLYGHGAKIFQVVVGNATDTSRVESLRGNPSTIQPMQKQLLLDLSSLGISLDNLEGITIGPRLQDGSLSLLLVSDDNFRDDQVTQFLLFRLKIQKN